MNEFWWGARTPFGEADGRPCSFGSRRWLDCSSKLVFSSSLGERRVGGWLGQGGNPQGWCLRRYGYGSSVRNAGIVLEDPFRWPIPWGWVLLCMKHAVVPLPASFDAEGGDYQDGGRAGVLQLVLLKCI